MAACGLYFFASNVIAQLAPPPQDYVAAIGTSPLKAPLTADFSPGANFTMEGWIFLTAHLPFVWLMGKDLGAAGADPFLSFALYLDNLDGTRLQFAYSTGEAGSFRRITSSTALPLRTWTHVAAVMEGSATHIVVNGNVVATGIASGAPPLAPGVPFSLGIAYRSDGRTNYSFFTGHARQVRFWNVSRTAAQLAAAASETLPTDRTGLVAAWPLDEASGATAHDTSGNGRPLTPANGALATARAAMVAARPFFSAEQGTTVTNASLLFARDAQLIDFDSDGDDDLITLPIGNLTIPGTPARLGAFRNNNGVFVEVTDAVLGNITIIHQSDNVVGDFNGDGRPDFFLAGYGPDTPPFPGEQAKLLIQSPDRRLVDESATRLPQRLTLSHRISVADIDGDGDLDIFLCNLGHGDGGPRFYINDGRGFFSDPNDRLPLDIANGSGGFPSSFLVDLNGDGRPDLVLGGGADGPNAILLNDGRGTFARDPRYVLPAKFGGPDWPTTSVSAADLDGNGTQDLLLATTGGATLYPDGRTVLGYAIAGLQLLLNRGNGAFQDITVDSGITWSSNDRSVARTQIRDINGDGRPDILAQVQAKTGLAQRLFLNLGPNQSPRFLDVSDAFDLPGYYTFFATDANRDGMTDLVFMSPRAVTVQRALKPLEVGRLANLSVRSQAGVGDQTLITGFAISGVGTKPLLVRAIGPTLSAFGVTGTLADPTVEIAPLGAARIIENDNWGGAASLKSVFTSVGAFALNADTSSDAALVFSPAAGAYTAKVSGTNDGTGIALVEVYDAGNGNTPRLTNVSARTQAGTGADALIVGFVLNGTLPKRLLIRAVGPTLAAFGVNGTLADPVLTLRPLGSEAVVASNDDWGGDRRAQNRLHLRRRLRLQRRHQPRRRDCDRAPTWRLHRHRLGKEQHQRRRAGRSLRTAVSVSKLNAGAHGLLSNPARANGSFHAHRGLRSPACHRRTADPR